MLLQNAAIVKKASTEIEKRAEIPTNSQGNGNFQILPVETFIQIVATLRDPVDWQSLSRTSKTIRNILVDIKSLLFNSEIACKFPPLLVKCFTLGKTPFLEDPELLSTRSQSWGSSLFENCFPTIRKEKLSNIQKLQKNGAKNDAVPVSMYYRLLHMQTWLKNMDGIVYAIMGQILQMTQRRIIQAQLQQQQNPGQQQQEVSKNLFLLSSSWDGTAALILHRYNLLRNSSSNSQQALDSLAADVEKLKILSMRYLMLLFAVVESSTRELQELRNRSITLYSSVSTLSSPQSSPPSLPKRSQHSHPQPPNGIPIRPSQNNDPPASHYHSHQSRTMQAQALVLSSTPPENLSDALFVLQYRRVRTLDTDSLCGLTLAYKTLHAHITALFMHRASPISNNASLCVRRDSTDTVLTTVTNLLGGRANNHGGEALLNLQWRGSALSLLEASLQAMVIIDMGGERMSTLLGDRNEEDDSEVGGSVGGRETDFTAVRFGPFLWNAFAGVLTERGVNNMP
ncbi:hypothetical protein HK100_006103 [Physocladia obscura]|uniref:Uncharacterized protein n=1 Tax=Physocladia obscura TaxID=109957 RepID=A0AAD5XBI8_9FUNG|nr:hypothetical protein HK100_006103 [Physocladia obscura]